MNKQSKSLTTHEKFLAKKTPKERKVYERGYQEFLLSELLIALMNEDNISVRKLAEAAGISPSNIQDIRSGKKQNMTVRNLVSILNVLGYVLYAKKGENTFPIHYSLENCC